MEIGARMARGAMWMVAWRVSDRTLGLVSTLVLARVLIPADFGLVAMANSVIAVLALLSAFSFDTALIQNHLAQRRHYDTAWTLGVMFGLFDAGVLVALAVPASHFYAEPRLQAVLYCLAATSLIGGLTNVGTVAFRKDLQLEKEFRFQVAKKVIMVITTMILALVFRSYWALVIAALVSSVLGIAISYAMHPYRPRFSLQGWHDLFHFSKWLVITNFLNFLQSRSVDFILGKVSGPRSLGVYNIAYEISNLPTTELVAPISRATFPGYTKLSLDLAVLRSMFLKVTGVIALITVPAGAGIAATSDLIVATALGPKWVDAAPLIALLGFYGVIQSLASNTGSVLLALGKVRALTIILGIQAAILVPALVWGAHRAGPIGVAVATLGVSAVLAPINLWQVFHAIHLRFIEFLAVIWRPLVAAASMYVVVKPLQLSWKVEGLFEQLEQTFVLVALGAIIYVLVVLLLWMLSSRPAGAEEYVLEKLQIRRRLMDRRRRVADQGSD
jgi:O-antigen/teichoic acid export membrane protein